MKKYLINNEEVNEKEFYENLENDVDDYCEDNYDDFLDEILDSFKSGSCEYMPSQVLRSVDEIAYTCGLSDYKNNEYENTVYTLENDLDEVYVNFTYYKIEEEDEA